MAKPDPNKPKKTPPKPAPKHKDAGKVVWISCRAKAGCEGNQAELVFRNKTGGEGTTARYKCMSCGGAFHIAT